MAATPGTESLLCAFCLETYEEPLNLSCGHSLCTRCVKQMAHFLLLRAEPSAESVALRCPTCNGETVLERAKAAEPDKALQPNRALRDVVVAARSPKCSLECGNPATVICERCEETFCDECFAQLHTKGVFRTHTSRPVGSAAASERNRCADCGAPHPKVVCKTCSATLLCSDCAHFSAKHKGHDCALVTDVLPSLREVIAADLAKLSAQRDTLVQQGETIAKQKQDALAEYERHKAKEAEVACVLQDVSEAIERLEKRAKEETSTGLFDVASMIASRLRALALEPTSLPSSALRFCWDQSKCGNQLVISEGGLSVSKPANMGFGHQQSSVLGTVALTSTCTWTLQIEGLQGSSWVCFGVSDGVDQNNPFQSIWGWSTANNTFTHGTNQGGGFTINNAGTVVLTYDASAQTLTAKVGTVTHTISGIPRGVFPALEICQPGVKVRLVS